ncbi:MAG: hypothetical protein JSV85_07020 [Candidatus Bathyarchaeota archaeon]|nr:MAG: hypothetical protein JSV85_07020 [Candidatus Bathyarchaeota archaeon]
MNEFSLHSAIKQWYSVSGDKFEVNVEDFIVDVVQDCLLIEIQTKNFSAARRKLQRLVEAHKVRLVYPIAKQKWIIRVAQSGELLSRRKSPKKGRLVDLFYELVRLPDLMKYKNFSLEVLMTEEEEVRCNDGKGSWRRRGASIKDRKLLGITERFLFQDEKDFLRFLPGKLPDRFTNKDLSTRIGVSINLARKITYCLKKMGTIAEVGKRGRELLFHVLSLETA